jgi:CDP-diacylglycerol--serine O-phosphatidyltransferase
MRNFRPIFPGVFTMGNLFCGFISIMSSADGQAVQACWFIILGFFLDGLDGFVARMSRGETLFGIELDSLADMVCFGVAPAMIFYSFKFKDLGKWGWVLGFVYVMCGAVRLARYNITAQYNPKPHFQGLPIPAAAAALTGYTLGSYELWGELRYVKFLVTLILGCSFLMVSDIEYEKRPVSFRTIKERIKWGYMALGGIALLSLHQLAIFPLVAVYILYGLAREAVLLVRSGLSGESLPDGRSRRRISHKAHGADRDGRHPGGHDESKNGNSPPGAG